MNLDFVNTYICQYEDDTFHNSSGNTGPYQDQGVPNPRYHTNVHAVGLQLNRGRHATERWGILCVRAPANYRLQESHVVCHTLL